MVEKTIKINDIEDAKKMVGIAMKCNCGVEIVNGTATINAKSIIGIFSIDFGKKTILRIDCDENSELIKMFEPFVIT